MNGIINSSYFGTLNFRGVEDINMDNMEKNVFDMFPNLDFVYVSFRII